MIEVILRKEFKQIFRNPTILRMMIMMPIIQLILIPFAANYEIKNINLAIVNQDNSPYAQRLIHKFTAGHYFKIVSATQDYRKALGTSEEGKADIIVTIPHHFERDLIKDNKAQIHLAADAVNGVKAGLGSAYAGQIIMNFNQEIRGELMQMPRHNDIITIKSYTKALYNPYYNYKLFMVPGILALLVTMVGALMSALNIVAEKEKGTIEQINVTPIKKYQFIIGKLLPFWFIGLFSITMGFVVAYIIFGLSSVGGYLIIYAYSAIYLVAVLGVGLLLSTFVDTQQQATLFSFFIMMCFVLLSGLYTQVQSMPVWAQWLSKMLPPSHYIQFIRSVFIKGSNFSDLGIEFGKMALFAIVLNALAIWNYRKRG